MAPLLLLVAVTATATGHISSSLSHIRGSKGIPLHRPLVERLRRNVRGARGLERVWAEAPSGDGPDVGTILSQGMEQAKNNPSEGLKSFQRVIQMSGEEVTIEQRRFGDLTRVNSSFLATGTGFRVE
eukprot:1364558-Amorphochlora_amoeboformis.AAC.1